MTPLGPPPSGARTAVAPGDLVAGKYRIERVLGEGGMGYVVAATHLQLDERVALKFLRHEALRNNELMARFAQEARAAAKIKSEHVARVSDVGALDDGTPYIVMEYLEGRDLESLLREVGGLRPDDVVEYVIQACAGLAEAHAAGVVHRDVKPENLFLVRRPDGSPLVKVLDFGVSKLALSATMAIDPHRTTALMGTPLYMSPEQIRSNGQIDARSDVWSLGAVLFEMLVGRPVFPAASLPELCMMVLEHPAPHVSSLRPELPAGLDEVVARCLSKDAADRFQNMADLAVALLPFAPRRARTVVERVVATITAAGGHLGSVLPPSYYPPPLSTSSADLSPPSRGTDANVATSLITPRPPPEGRRRVAGAAALIVAAVGCLGLLVARQLGPSPASATPAALATTGDGAPASADPAASEEAPAPEPSAAETAEARASSDPNRSGARPSSLPRFRTPPRVLPPSPPAPTPRVSAPEQLDIRAKR